MHQTNEACIRSDGAGDNEENAHIYGKRKIVQEVCRYLLDGTILQFVGVATVGVTFHTSAIKNEQHVSIVVF